MQRGRGGPGHRDSGYDGSRRGGGGPYGGHYGERNRGRGGGYRGRGRGRFGLGSDGPQSKFQKSYSSEVIEAAEQLYGKKFKLLGEWKLPDLSSWFSKETQVFQVPELVEIKENLRGVLSRLEEEVEISSWVRHSQFSNRTGMVMPAIRRDYEPEMCTQGWTKMHEILWTFKDVVPESDLKLMSVHLCEAPGAFVASLNHFLGTHRMDCSWQWKAITLNPYYEGHDLSVLIDQDKFMSETKQHWSVGVDDTGDITSWENFRKFKAEVDEELEGVHLVTADGSMDCSKRRGEEEEMVAHLVFCEVVASFFLLRLKGNLVVKTYTTLEHRSVCLMYLLACCFEEVNVFKPATSKSGNSEQYVVCLGFKGHDLLTSAHQELLKQAFCSKSSSKAFFPREAIPDQFIGQLVNCASFFSKRQIESIENSLRHYECMTASEKQFIIEVKEYTTGMYKSRFKLKKLAKDKNIVPHVFMNGTMLSLMSSVQGDPTKEWTEKRNVEEFVGRWRDSVKKGQEDSSDEEDEDDDDEDDDDEEEENGPSKKRRKMDQDEAASQAIKYLLGVIGYDGLPRATEPSFVLLEMEAGEVQWLKDAGSSDMYNNLTSKDGCLTSLVKNSRFCRHEILQKLSDTLTKSEIMKQEHEDEYTDVASHICPGLSLSVAKQPYFLNSDALNYAMLDHLTHFTSTFEELLFMDLAGAPSGFSHYIYWKKKDQAKGWGMVRKENPKLGPGKVMEHLAPWETFQVLGPHAGVDISDSTMIKSLCAGIKNYCPEGIHLVIGDVPSIPFGALSIGSEESLSKTFLLSQLICACKILREGGMFICRVYSLLSRFTAGLFFVMYKLFQEVAIIKPITSVASSAERFIVCRGYRSCKSSLTQLLLDVNAHIRDLRKKNETTDVLEILPIQQLFEEQFYRYLCLSNERIAKYRIRMITHLDSRLKDLEKLPTEEEKDLLGKGLLEILHLPNEPV